MRSVVEVADVQGWVNGSPQRKIVLEYRRLHHRQIHALNVPQHLPAMGQQGTGTVVSWTSQHAHTFLDERGDLHLPKRYCSWELEKFLMEAVGMWRADAQLPAEES